MELSKERLEWITKISGREDIEDIDGWEIREMARRQLAAEEQQPVAYIIQDKYERQNGQPGHLSRSHIEEDASPEDINEHGISCTPLYLHPQQGKAVQVPDENGLLPCPFCGGVASVVDNRLGFYVICNNGECDATAIGPRVRELNSEQEANAIDWNDLEQSAKDKWNRRAAMLEPVSNRDELREQVRREHAEWSDKTFGKVGPVGPLKHLSKEALEAAANPEDPLEWADMQFLLWDAQRRMGISDDFITRAMIEKLAINKTRQWPEPKDGEPRMHVKEAGNSPAIPDGWVMLPAEPTQAMMNAWLSEVANWRGHAAGYRAMIAAAPEVK